MSDSVQSHRRKPTRLPRPWDSPGKNTGVGCHFLLQCMKGKVKVKSLSCVRLLVTPWTAAYQAPLSMGFSRRDYWSGLPCPPPGDLPDPRIEPASLTSPALVGRFFTTSTTWSTCDHFVHEYAMKDFLSYSPCMIQDAPFIPWQLLSSSLVYIRTLSGPTVRIQHPLHLQYAVWSGHITASLIFSFWGFFPLFHNVTSLLVLRY